MPNEIILLNAPCEEDSITDTAALYKSVLTKYVKGTHNKLGKEWLNDLLNQFGASP